MVFSILRQKGAGRRWRERGLSKIDSNWGKHCCCCWFGQKWPSNRIKYDSRTFEHPHDCSSSDFERGFGKELTVRSIFIGRWMKFIHLPMKMELTVSSETSAIRTQTPGNYPKRNKLHLEHGESLKTKKRKLCACFVPHSLTPEQREDWVTSCQDIIAMADADKNFFNKIIMGDETWCFACDPKTKWQFWMGWWDIPPGWRNLQFQRSRIKTMLIIFSTLKA